MKTIPSLYTNIITVIGAAFLLLNLKKEFAEPEWNTLFIIPIFILNAIECQKNFKNRNSNKPE